MNALKRYSAAGAFKLLVTTLVVGLVIGCAALATPAASPVQQAINTGVASYTSLDQAILLADAAVKSGVLKGQDAKNALAGFTAAKAGLDAGLVALRSANAAAAAAAASAASGASK